MHEELIFPADVFARCIYFIFYGFGWHAAYFTVRVGIVEVIKGCLFVYVAFVNAEFGSFVLGKVY